MYAYIWGPNRVFGKTEESEDKIFGKVKKWRLKISLNFPHVKTKEWRPAECVNIKCEDCVRKCEDPKVNYGWLDPHIYAVYKY